MPDPHNPFEMHRLRLAREDKPASPAPLFSKPETAQPHKPEQVHLPRSRVGMSLAIQSVPSLSSPF